MKHYVDRYSNKTTLQNKPVLTSQLYDISVIPKENLISIQIIGCVLVSKHLTLNLHRLLDSLVVECWLRVREVLDSIPNPGPRHTKDVIKNGTSSSLV